MATCRVRLKGSKAIHRPAHVLVLELQIIILISAIILKYLFISQDCAGFSSSQRISPCQQSEIYLSQSSLLARMTYSSSKAFVAVNCASSGLYGCYLFLGVLWMYQIVNPVCFADAKASMLMNCRFIFRLFVGSAKGERCPNTCCGIEAPSSNM